MRDELNAHTCYMYFIYSKALVWEMDAALRGKSFDTTMTTLTASVICTEWMANVTYTIDHLVHSSFFSTLSWMNQELILTHDGTGKDWNLQTASHSIHPLPSLAHHYSHCLCPKRNCRSRGHIENMYAHPHSI